MLVVTAPHTDPPVHHLEGQHHPRRSVQGEREGLFEYLLDLVPVDLSHQPSPLKEGERDRKGGGEEREKRGLVNVPVFHAMFYYTTTKLKTCNIQMSCNLVLLQLT